MALVCRIKGYKLKVVLPGNVSIERRQLLELWGAEVIDSPADRGLQRRGPPGPAGSRRSHPEWAFLYQYANPANPRAHYEGTGPEIWRDCPEITHFVAGPGHVRDPARRRALPEGGKPAGAGLGGRAAGGRDGRRACATSTTATSLRSSSSRTAPTCSTARPSSAPGVDRVDAAADRRGHLRRASRRGPPWPAPSSAPDATRGAGPSWWSPPTAGGSTSRPAPGPTISTWSPSGPSEIIYF